MTIATQPEFEAPLERSVHGVLAAHGLALRPLAEVVAANLPAPDHTAAAALAARTDPMDIVSADYFAALDHVWHRVWAAIEAGKIPAREVPAENGIGTTWTRADRTPAAAALVEATGPLGDLHGELSRLHRLRDVRRVAKALREAATIRGAAKLSSTIRNFSASVQRRRRPVSVTERTSTGDMMLCSAIASGSYSKPGRSVRRPSPDEYFQRRKAPAESLSDPTRPTRTRHARRACNRGGSLSVDDHWEHVSRLPSRYPLIENAVGHTNGRSREAARRHSLPL